MQHLDAAHDHTGQFIAYTNLGVVLVPPPLPAEDIISSLATPYSLHTVY
jgi:hypothetical protein